MTVKAILEQKGHDVLTLGPNEKLSAAIKILAERRIGALVITIPSSPNFHMSSWAVSPYNSV